LLKNVQYKFTGNIFSKQHFKQIVIKTDLKVQQLLKKWLKKYISYSNYAVPLQRLLVLAESTYVTYH